MSPKRWLSRWIMRSQEGGKVLRMGLLGITAVSTLTTALKGTSLQPYTIHIIGGLSVASLGFLYLYDESGVLNQQNVERMDRADNFAGPGMAMGALLRSKQLAALMAELNDDMTLEEAERQIHDPTLEALRDFRTGIDIEYVFEDGHSPSTGNDHGGGHPRPRPATDGGELSNHEEVHE